jgi:hypothetical protein
MRVSLACMLLVLFAGIASGQDTNFSSGPQYLLNSEQMKNGLSFFARPISTPSMSLEAPPLEIGASNATGTLVAGAGNQNVLTPMPDALPKTDLFPILYGVPPASVIEIRFASEASANELPANPLPASILDTGVWQMTTAKALRERGYGSTLAEGAAYGKAQTRHANRVYTNADIDRLHSGS